MSNEITKHVGTHLGAADELKLPAPKQIESGRAIAEAQAATLAAKNWPRDIDSVLLNIVNTFKRKKAAENSSYAYKKGGQMVTGPSIRAAEAIAMSYGNMSYGTIELSRNEDSSEVMCFAHDLQTNVRSTKVFNIPNFRSSKDRGRVALTDDRDRYENLANMSARRLRSCILAVVPQDLVELALEQAEKTLQEDGKNTPLQDRVRNMLIAFQDLGVDQAMIETRLQHKTTAINEQELVQLRKIYTAIKDGMSDRKEFFKLKEEVKESNLNERFEEKQ